MWVVIAEMIPSYTFTIEFALAVKAISVANFNKVSQKWQLDRCKSKQIDKL